MDVEANDPAAAGLIEPILAASHDSDPAIRARAIGLAAYLAPQNTGALERLHEGLEDPDIKVIYAAAVKLAELKSEAHGVATALLRVLQADEDNLPTV